MRRRSFLQRAGIGAMGLLGIGAPALASDHISLWTCISDRLFYRPWSTEELADRVAWMMANASHKRNWGRPVEPGPPVTGRLRHSFTFLTAEEIAERNAKEEARCEHRRP